MTSLVPTLAALVRQADALHADGQYPKARRLYEDLVQRAQERADRVTESIARVMLARCMLRLRELDHAREELALAARITDPANVDGYARYRAALVRLALDEGPPDTSRRELREYRRWAEQAGSVPAALDACLLSAGVLPVEERVDWLERALDQARGQDADRDAGDAVHASAELARAYGEYGSALDQVGKTDLALAAYQHAERIHRGLGRVRDGVASGWAAGALACRLEDWPLARATLEGAIRAAELTAECDDLVALALADLASVYEAAGDVIEARRLILRAMAMGREQHLAAVWPERWELIVAHARRLDL